MKQPHPILPPYARRSTLFDKRLAYLPRDRPMPLPRWASLYFLAGGSWWTAIRTPQRGSIPLPRHPIIESSRASDCARYARQLSPDGAIGTHSRGSAGPVARLLW